MLTARLLCQRFETVITRSANHEEFVTASPGRPPGKTGRTQRVCVGDQRLILDAGPLNRALVIL